MDPNSLGETPANDDCADDVLAQLPELPSHIKRWTVTRQGGRYRGRERRLGGDQRGVPAL